MGLYIPASITLVFISVYLLLLGSALILLPNINGIDFLIFCKFNKKFILVADIIALPIKIDFLLITLIISSTFIIDSLYVPR